MTETRLLVVEDSVGIAKLVCHIATESGFIAATAYRGEDVMRLYDEFRPHVIVLDILMPDVDGFEILHFLHKRGSDARVVILSGSSDFRPMAERIARGLKIDIVANVAKPFRAHELISLFETLRFSLVAPEQRVSA